MELTTYKKELEEELKNILDYWMNNTIDHQYGGFMGKIDDKNIIYAEAPKGSVLNARILWTFSAVYNKTREKQFLLLAGRAFEYIHTHFIDKEYGGVYWTVDYKGRPLDTKKQVYALAFAIYACSEYYKCSGNETAKQVALDLYELIQQYSYDQMKSGYFEAFTKEWKQIPDLRLSDKDANEKKTMNTHLHILEAYTNLYRVCPVPSTRKYIAELLENFNNHFINKETWRLDMFFDEAWTLKSNTISFGHDIEASWLMLEAAETISDSRMIEVFKNIAVQMASAVSASIDKDGGLWYEYEPSHGLIKEKHWWPQAEAMIGFFNAWQITKEDKFLQYSINNWNFVKNYILDKKNGEWFWGINEDYTLMKGEDKLGIWKCPYHNARACIEIIRRIETIL